MNPIVYTTTTGTPTPTEHARIIARIAAATTHPGWVRCRCGYERRAGIRCGEPCV